MKRSFKYGKIFLVTAVLLMAGLVLGADPSIGVTSPATGTYWKNGSQNIVFSVTDSDNPKDMNATLYYSTIAGAKQNKISDLNLMQAGLCASQNFGAGTTCTFPWVNSLADGNYFIDITVNDLNNSDSASTSSASFMADSSAPTITIIKPNDGNTSYTSKIVEFDVNSVGSPVNKGSISVTIVGKSSNAFTADSCVKSGTNFRCSYTEPGFDVGGTMYILRVNASDLAGNTAPQTSSEFTYVDIGAPDKVTGLSVSTGNESATVSWNANGAADFNAYFVYMSQSDGFTAEAGNRISVTTGTSFTKSGLSNGTTYYFRVKAGDKSGNLSEQSDQISAKPSSGAVSGAPEISSNSHNNDDWTANDDPEFTWSEVANTYKYRYSLTSESDSVPDSTNETSDRSKVYSNIDEGERWFNVRACNSLGECGGTAHYRIRIDKTGPSPPENITGFSQSDGSIYMSWTEAIDNYSGAAEYEIFRSIKQQVNNRDFRISDPGVQKFSGISGTSFTDDSDLTTGIRYYYRIRAIDKAGNIGNISPIRGILNSATSCSATFSENIPDYVKAGDLSMRFESSTALRNVRVEVKLPEQSKRIVAENLNGDVLEATVSVPSGMNGEAEATVSGHDTSGNYCEHKVSFTVDSENPTLGGISVGEGQEISGVTVLSADVSGTGSGINSGEVVVDGSKAGNLVYNSSNGKYEFNLDSTSLENGEHVVEIIVKDLAGNEVSSKLNMKVANKESEGEQNNGLEANNDVGTGNKGNGDLTWVIFIAIVLALLGGGILLVTGGGAVALGSMRSSGHHSGKDSGAKGGKFSYRGK